MKRSRIERKTRLRSSGPIRSTGARVTRSAALKRKKNRADPLWSAARSVALDRDEGRCCRCGDLATEVHHRRLKGAGGSTLPDRHRPDRLVSLCAVCHDWVHGALNRRPAEAAGLIVRRTHDTLTTPVLTRHGLLLLTADARCLPVQRAA